MKKLMISLLIITVLFASIYFPASCFAQEAYIVKQDTYGAYTKEGIKKLLNVILSKDAKVLPTLVAAGQIFTVKKGAKVFIEEQLLWEGIVKARLQGQAMSVWLLEMDLAPEEDYRSKSAQNESNKNKDSSSSGYRIEGIVYDKVKPAVIIGGKIHFVNDSIDGIKIIAINPDEIEVQQEEGAKILKIGDSLQTAP